MRRALSTLLLLLVGLGPLTAVLPASEDARLPACCRRNGVHKCAITAQMAAILARMMAQDSSPGFTAPTTCPSFPGTIAALLGQDAALTARAVSMPAVLDRAHELAAGRADAIENPVRAHAGRGPPADLLS